MDKETALALARGMIDQAGWRHSVLPDRKTLRVGWSDTATFITTEEGVLSDRTFIAFRTTLAEDFDVTPKSRLAIHEWVNDKNGSFRSCRFILRCAPPESPKAKSVKGRVDLEYELLADDLQLDEFRHVLGWLGQQSQQLDAEFIGLFGGKTEREAFNARAAERAEQADDGPSVDT